MRNVDVPTYQVPRVSVGDSGTVALLRPTQDEFWRKVDRSPLAGACWLWRGRLTATGYGHCRVKVYDSTVEWWTSTRAHRLSYQLEHGPIDQGLVIDHLCYNVACVNPAHLEPITHLENIRRSREVRPRPRQQYCVHGHERIPENMRPGRRDCAICHRLQSRRYRSRQVGGVGSD